MQENELKKPHRKLSIESDLKYLTQGKRHFGTKLDDTKHEGCPSTCVGFEFAEMDHHQLRQFLGATDREKFELAFWAERNAGRRGAYGGFFFAVFSAVVLLSILSWVF